MCLPEFRQLRMQVPPNVPLVMRLRAIPRAGEFAIVGQSEFHEFKRASPSSVPLTRRESARSSTAPPWVHIAVDRDPRRGLAPRLACHCALRIRQSGRHDVDPECTYRAELNIANPRMDTRA